MAKVNIKSEKITLFGGIYYAIKAFYALSLDKVINGTLGVRRSIIKKFVFHFTAVCAKWTRTARRWWLNLYTDLNVFGFLSRRYTYAYDKNLKILRKDFVR